MVSYKLSGTELHGQRQVNYMLFCIQMCASKESQELSEAKDSHELSPPVMFISYKTKILTNHAEKLKY